MKGGKLEGKIIKTRIQELTQKAIDMNRLIKNDIRYKERLGNEVNEINKKIRELTDLIKDKNKRSTKKETFKQYQHKKLRSVRKKKNSINDIFNAVNEIDSLSKCSDFDKYRIFHLSCHGFETPKFNVEYGYDRFDPKTLLNNYNIKPENLSIIYGQPFGRSSPRDLNNLYTTHNNKKNNILLFKGLINMKTEHEIKIMDYYTTGVFIEYYKNMGVVWTEQNLKTIFPKDKEIKTSSDIVNYMKYNHKNYPEKQLLVMLDEHYYNCPRGIFEITPKKNKGDIDKINNIIKIKYNEKQAKTQHLNYDNPQRNSTCKDLLGLNISNSDKQKYKDILKYNIDFYKSNNLHRFSGGLLFFIGDVLETILKNGNIQPDEKILLITNFCRPIEKTSGRVKQGFNNALNQSNKQIEKKAKLRRRTSKKKMLKSLAPSK